MFEDRNRLPDASLNVVRTTWTGKGRAYRDMTVCMMNLFGELEIWNRYCDFYDGLTADRVLSDPTKIKEFLSSLNSTEDDSSSRFIQ